MIHEKILEMFDSAMERLWDPAVAQSGDALNDILSSADRALKFGEQFEPEHLQTYQDRHRAILSRVRDYYCGDSTVVGIDLASHHGSQALTDYEQGYLNTAYKSLGLAIRSVLEFGISSEVMDSTLGAVVDQMIPVGLVGQHRKIVGFLGEAHHFYSIGELEEAHALMEEAAELAGVEGMPAEYLLGVVDAAGKIWHTYGLQQLDMLGLDDILEN